MISPTMILIAVLGAFVLFGSGLMTGIKIESDRNKAAMLELERQIHNEYKQKIEAQRVISQQISQELNDATTAREREAIAFADELRRARETGKPLAVCAPAPAPRAQRTKLVTMPVPAAPPAPRTQPVEPPVDAPPMVLLTGDFVRLFDAGTTTGLSGARNSGSADATAASPGPVSPEEVLAVNGANGSICNGLRAQVIGFQNLVREHGWWK